MNEYIFYSPEKLDFPLNESIKIIDDPKKVNETCIISNSKEIKAEVYAPEINFCIKNSEDSIADMIKNIEILYTIRSIKLDYATDFESEKEIGNKLLLVGDKEDLLQIEEFFDDSFELYFAGKESVVKIEGTIGELVVYLSRNGKVTPLAVDQMVWFNAPKSAFSERNLFENLFSNKGDVE